MWRPHTQMCTLGTPRTRLQLQISTPNAQIWRPSGAPMHARRQTKKKHGTRARWRKNPHGSILSACPEEVQSERFSLWKTPAGQHFFIINVTRSTSLAKTTTTNTKSPTWTWQKGLRSIQRRTHNRNNRKIPRNNTQRTPTNVPKCRKTKPFQRRTIVRKQQ